MNLGLPFDITPENLPNYYQISSPEGRIVENNLFISFSIPLVNSAKYKLYKATSLPYKIKDTNLYAFIVPKYEYFALDYNYEDFIDISKEELNNCHKVNENLYVCKQNFPIFSTFDSKVCEVNMMKGTNYTEQCDIRVSNMTNELWIRIHKYNTYIYALPKKQLIHVTCFNETEILSLYETGIITIFPDCKLKSNGMEIIGFRTYTSTVLRSFTPSIPFYVNISLEVNNLVRLPGFEMPTIHKSEVISNGDWRKRKIN